MAIVFSLSLAASGDLIIKYKAQAIVTNRMSFKMKGTYNIAANRNYCDLTSTFGLIEPREPGASFDIISNSIIRLDKGVRWSFSGDNGYIEKAITSIHDPDSMELVEGYIWSFNAAPIDRKKNFNKLDCRGQIGKATGVNENDPADTVFITFEQWLTEDTLIGAEFVAYWQEFARVAGAHKMWAQEHMATYMEKGYGAQCERLSDLMGGPKSLPIKSIITIEKSLLYDRDAELFGEPGKTGGVKRRGSGMRPEKGGRWKLLHLTNEITGIEQISIEDSKFEIPPNYEKK
jgi:hypothetical protein